MKKAISILVFLVLILSISSIAIPLTLASSTTVFTEDFEGAWPGSWSVGDTNAANGLDYWGDNTYKKHTGSWSGWCADEGVQSDITTILSENFEGTFPGTAVVGDWESANGLDYWDDTNYRSHAGSRSGWCAQVGTQAGTTTTIWTEGFEGAWPGPWYVGDWNSANGYDYWGDNTHRSHTGSWSGWCADEGYQPTLQTIFSEGFEGAWPGPWYVGDWNSASGYDYWGDNDYRKYSGSWSAWCADYGDQHDLIGIPNTWVHRYDDDMQAYMYRYVSLGSYSGVSLSYKYWLNCESGFDYLEVMYQSGGTWYYIDMHTPGISGWQSSAVSIPTTATAVGFYFYADFSNHGYEGAYVDDVLLRGYPSNNLVHRYDDNMNAYMYRSASLGGYSSVSLSYWYWLDCESGFDYLEVMYYSAGTWTYTDKHTPGISGWQSSAVSIPNTATYVGFRFYSDGSYTYEGAYIDDITLSGIPEVPNTSVHRYDDYQHSYMYWAVSLGGGYASVSLSYWYWLNCESGWDYLQVMYQSGGTWYYIDTHTPGTSSWESSTVTIPTSATHVGFFFHSDDSYHTWEGAYIDDILLQGYRYNNVAHQYDDYMDAYMYRPVSLSGYTSVSLSYWYWLDSEPGYDYLQVMYQSGGTWYYIDPHTGNSGGWQQSTVSIPTTATYVGFRFYGDYMIHNFEGAYIDDIICTGHIFEFSISASPSSRTIECGQSTTYSVTVTLTNPPSQTVSLSLSGLPSGTNYLFSPSSGNPTFTSTLTVTTSPSTPRGTYTLTITGTGGGKTHSTTVTLIVQNFEFSISASPSSRTVPPTGSTTYGVTVTLVHPPTHTVTLSVSGLPSGASGSFSPPSGSPTFTSTLTVTTSSTPLGTYTLTITGTGPCIHGSHSTTVTLIVQTGFEFSVSASPASRIVVAGASTTYTATATLVSGSGTVTWSASGLPTGASGTFSPPSGSPTFSSTFTVTTSTTTPPGAYTITITGTGPCPHGSHSTTVQLKVMNFTVTPSPFSPNGDGRKDTTTIRATFWTSLGWTLVIKNSAGTIVRHLATGTSISLTQVWNGRDDAGAVVPDGTYKVCLSGPGFTKTKNVKVDTTRPTVTCSWNPNPFNPHATPPQTSTCTYTLSEKCTVSIKIYNAADVLVKTLLATTTKNAGTYTIVWDGKNNAGAIVPAGTYTCKVYVTDMAGNQVSPYPKTCLIGVL